MGSCGMTPNVLKGYRTYKKQNKKRKNNKKKKMKKLTISNTVIERVAKDRKWLTYKTEPYGCYCLGCRAVSIKFVPTDLKDVHFKP